MSMPAATPADLAGPPPAPLADFDRAIATTADPAEIWSALHRLADRVVGTRLFTVMRMDLAANLSGRVFTSDPAAYPLAGTKPIHRNAWFAQIHDRQQMFVANTYEEIAAVLFDHELIRSLGCESIVNLPVALGGEVVGTVNLLNRAGWFTPDRLARLAWLTLPARAAFLATA